MHDAEKIHMARFRARLNITELAAMTGLNPRTIYNAERGKKVNKSTVILIAQALGHKVDDFLLDEYVKGG